MSKGIIYITTTSVTGLIKIGKTQTNQFEDRMRNLEQNGYWNVSGLKRFYAVEVEDYSEKEKLIHTVFSKSRVANSELFALDTSLAKEMLEAFEGVQIYPKTEISTNLVNTTKNIKRSSNVVRFERKRFSFKELQISIGARLEYIDDPDFFVTVADEENHVLFQGEKTTLSKLAEELRGTKAEQGPKFFTYNGEILTERRMRLQREKEQKQNGTN